jgi:alpha-glucosidase
MFETIRHLLYQEAPGHEHLWIDTTADCLIAGTLLGSSVIRVRVQRGQQVDTARYKLASGTNGTLPYHSWIVERGDEHWATGVSEEEARAIVEPYTRGFAASPDALRLTQPLESDERVFGLGERTGSMNKRGQAFPIWNIDPHKGHDFRTVTMYTSIPFYLCHSVADGRISGVLIDHTGRVEMDIGKSDARTLSATVAGDSLVVYFFTGPTAFDVQWQYSALTGRMPLPPRWAIGYHQCRWGYASAQNVLEVASQLRERRHPCDAIWLDIDYMNGYRNFTWDSNTFPHPEQMAAELHEQGLHLVTILDPGVKIDEQYAVYQQGLAEEMFCRMPDGSVFTGSVWPGACHFPDFSQQKVRRWWGDLYKRLLDTGVDGIWNDMNEPALTGWNVDEKRAVHLDSNTMPDQVVHEAGDDNTTSPDGQRISHQFFHNAYGMEMARSTYNGLSRLRPDSRPFVLTRSGTAGMQRYAALWTGDNWSRWQDIAMAIPMCLNISMSGVPFVGVDIGGFWESSNGELLVRFAQLGALLPFCRNHSAITTARQEPWAFGEPYESAFRTALETRYRLLPYLYTLFREASRSGAPVIRPLYYHYPQDEQACDREDELLIGDSLLSAPIYEPGVTSRRVYLPEGAWFDFWSGQEYPGAGWSELPAPLARWPFLIRGNSILPTGPLMQHTGELPTDPLTLTCYMTANGLANFKLYEDDGSSLAYRAGSFAETRITCRASDEGATVEIEERFNRFRPQRETYEIVVHIGGKTLRQTVQAGQGETVVRL